MDTTKPKHKFTFKIENGPSEELLFATKSPVFGIALAYTLAYFSRFRMYIPMTVTNMKVIDRQKISKQKARLIGTCQANVRRSDNSLCKCVFTAEYNFVREKGTITLFTVR